MNILGYLAGYKAAGEVEDKVPVKAVPVEGLVNDYISQVTGATKPKKGQTHPVSAVNKAIAYRRAEIESGSGHLPVSRPDKK